MKNLYNPYKNCKGYLDHVVKLFALVCTLPKIVQGLFSENLLELIHEIDYENNILFILRP